MFVDWFQNRTSAFSFFYYTILKTNIPFVFMANHIRILSFRLWFSLFAHSRALRICVPIFSDPTTQKAHLAVCFSLMEKERYKADLFFRYSVGVYLVCFRKAVQNCVRSEKSTSAATSFTESEVFRKSVFATVIFSCINA